MTLIHLMLYVDPDRETYAIVIVKPLAKLWNCGGLIYNLKK